MARKPLSLSTVMRRLTVLLTAMLTLCIAACGNASSGAGAPVEITYTYTDFSGVQPDLSAVQVALNAILKPKYNFTVKLIDIPYASYDQKTKLLFTSGSPCDAIFTASWTNPFVQNVTQGNLLDLTDLLNKYGQGTYASMPAATWNAAKVNGKIYGSINQQIFGKPWGVLLSKSLATKYNIDLSKVKSFSDLTPFLAEIKAGEPGITPVYTSDSFGIDLWHATLFGYDDSVGSDLGIKYNDPALQVVNTISDPGFTQLAQLAYSWHQAGYTTKDLTPAADAEAALKAGKYAFYLNQARPGSEATFKLTYGYDVVQQAIAAPILTTETIQATLNGICRSSQHPVQAMEFLNELNTNKTLFNIMAHGIADKDYTVVDASKNLIAVNKDSGYNPNTDWMFGSQFNSYYTDATSADANLWQLHKSFNDNSPPSLALGFVFDPSKVKTQVAQVAAADKQYLSPIINGLVDPSTAIPQYQQALKAAGIDQIIAEAQSQVNAWKAANGK